MAKKRDLLDADYNPVAEQIRRYKESVAVPEPSSAAPATVPLREAVIAPPRVSPAPPTPSTEDREPDPPVRTAPLPLSKPRPQPIVAPVIEPEEPLQEEEASFSAAHTAGSDALSTSMRTRVTREEHQHWTDVCLHITGKQNQFSALVRALLIILENAQDELEKKLPEIHRMRVPPRTDRLANSLYEYRLAEILYQAIEAAGAPRPPGVMRQKR